MNKSDRKLAAVILLVAMLAGFFLWRYRMGGSDCQVIIEQNGDVLQKLSLTESLTVRVSDPATGGFNVVEIRDGQVCVRDADCPDRICVKQKYISKAGELIVCLPHRLVVRLEHGSGKGEAF